MFAGHAGLAMLGKAARQRVPLVFLGCVAFAPDIIQRAFLMVGQSDREFSHSMPAVGIGATVVALSYYLMRRSADLDDAIVIWLTYISHWPADYITGIKPTWPGGPMVGLVTYLHPARDAFIEIDLVLLCWLAYRSRLAADRKNAWVTLLIPIALIVAQLAFDFNLAPGVTGL